MFHGMLRDRALEVENEELIVDELAKALHQIIRDNPIMFYNADDVEFVLEESEDEVDVQAIK